MSTAIESDHIIRKPTCDGYVDGGVIVHVDNATGDCWWIPGQERDERNQRLKHLLHQSTN